MVYSNVKLEMLNVKLGHTPLYTIYDETYY